jgi:inositol-hexakisphosphate kinase
MPPSLHPHLKRGLDFDDFHVDPEDLIEEPPAEYEDPAHRAAKRRRIEAIVAKYLRGQPPVIITAALKGPFDNGWKNPWTRPIVEKRRTSGKGNTVVGGRNANSKKVAVGRNEPAKRRSSSRLNGGNEANVAEDAAPQMASPETSRAARDDLDRREHDDSLDEIEVPPATAPLPDNNDDASSTAEFFSTNTNMCIQNRSPMTNPFWLRRPGSARVDMRKATNKNTDASPTRSRSRNSTSQTQTQTQTQTTAELRLSLPKAPIRPRMSAPDILEAEPWRSSASASMVISSPVKDADTDVQAQATPIASPQRSQRTVPIITSSMGSQGTSTRNAVQQFAECLCQTSASTIRQQPRSSSRQSIQNAPASVVSQSNRIASPAPASSTGKVRRKTKLKPRAVNFDSSPEKVPSAKKPCTEEDIAHIEADDGLQGASTEVDTVDAQASPQAEGDCTVVEDEKSELRTSRGSDWSTQAAMVRAQLEFQQSTFPMVSPEVLRLDSQTSLLDTPGPVLAAASAAVTPFSAFTVQRDEPLAPETILQAPPISTQDLFGAASPFAFSTVKKKPEEAQRSNLRFALSPSDGVLKADAVAKSPTPTAERIPLKNKDNMTSFWSFTTDKASQEIHGSFGDMSKGALNDVGFPALDIDTSLGDFGPTGSLDFTDRFLRNLDDT